jgi:hypothetical protein
MIEIMRPDKAWNRTISVRALPHHRVRRME